MLYDWLLVGHVLAVIVWVGGGVWTQIYAMRARAASDDALFSGLVKQAAWAGNRVFMPASLLVLVFGVLLVVRGPWDFEDTWVALGIVGYVLTAVNGGALLGPASRRFAAAAVEHGDASAEATAFGRRIVNLMAIDLVIVTLVVVDMIVKPGA